MKKFLWFRWFLAIAMALVLSACGGDSGDAPVNHAPTAADQNIITDEDRAKSITLKATDADGDTLTYSLVSNPSHGTLSGTAPNLTYTPNANYHGSDSFKFKAKDSKSDSNTATVNITVKSINDAPVATNYEMTLDVNKTSIESNWLSSSGASDIDGDSLSASIKTNGSYGAFMVVGNTIKYTKNTETKNSDQCVLSISDGEKSVDITITLNSLYWKEISAGYDYALAIKSDGTLWAWGSGSFGKLGNGSSVDQNRPVQVGTKNNWVSVSAGADHSMALNSNGEIWCWGHNASGELGNNSTIDSKVPVQEYTKSTNWIAISAGDSYSMALNNKGEIWSWGLNDGGQLGNNSTTDSNVPVQEYTKSKKWVAISAGAFHAMALNSNGEIWSWGGNDEGELGNNSTADSSVPVQENTGSTNWVAISAGAEFSVALNSNGEIWSWGYNDSGQLGVDPSSVTNSTVPIQESTNATNWKTISASLGYSVLATKSDNTLYGWGDNYNGVFGNGDMSNISYTPIQEKTKASNWSKVDVGEVFALAIDSNGVLYTWGSNGDKALGNGKSAYAKTATQEASDSNWTQISSNGDTSCAIKTDKTLWCWGKNSYHQLGRNDNEYYASLPVQEESNSTNWLSVSVGKYHVVALKEDGTIWGWGMDNYGQLGSLSNPTKEPTQIGTDTDWSDIQAGGYHTVALKTDGKLYSWGKNSYGQLGDGTNTNSSTPVQENSSSTWSQIAAGRYHTCAVRSDKKIYCWGRNNYGQLGNNSTTDSLTPVQENSGASNWTKVTISSSSMIGTTLALNDNGEIWGWGYNHYGQLGTGSTTDKQLTPAQESTNSTDWIDLSTGGNHTLALKSDKSLYGWGVANGYCLIFNQSSGTEYNPVKISDESWSDIKADDGISFAIKNNGTLYGWGYNEHGELGIEELWVPKPVFERK